MSAETNTIIFFKSVKLNFYSIGHVPRLTRTTLSSQCERTNKEIRTTKSRKQSTKLNPGSNTLHCTDAAPQKLLQHHRVMCENLEYLEHPNLNFTTTHSTKTGKSMQEADLSCSISTLAETFPLSL